MTRDTLAKLGLFGSLYLSQGIPNGFFRQAAPVIFREKGMSLEEIGLTALLYLPWAFKFLWAPLVDRIYAKRFGRRRSWIVPLQLLTAAFILLLAAWTPDSSLIFLIVVIALINLASATQDAATDGYAVDLLEKSERGWGNGIQIGSFWMGFVLGGGVILVLHARLGWTPVFLFMAGAVALAVAPVLLRSEAKPGHLEQGGAKLAFGLGAFLRRPHVKRMLLIIVVYRLADGFIRAMLNPMLVDLGLDMETIGWLVGVIGPLAALLGAVIGGLLANPLGRRNALLAFGGLQLLSAGAYYGVALNNISSMTVLVPVIILDHMIISMATVAVYSLMMDWSSKHQGGTEYTLQDCAGIFAMIFASVFSGIIAGSFGYAANFAVAMVVIIGSVSVVAWLFREPLTAGPQLSPRSVSV